MKLQQRVNMQHNHYLPQKYLLRFADMEGRVWLHDKNKSDSAHPGVRVIGNELGLYSKEVEASLNSETEIPSHCVFDKVMASVPLSKNDRIVLAKYIVLMWKRVPTAKVRSLGRMSEIVDAVHDDLMAKIDEIVAADPSSRENADNARVRAKVYMDAVKADPPPNLWYNSFNLAETSKPEEALLSMNWVFLLSEKHEFLTSDNPVFFFPAEGVGRPQSELTFPISSSLALWATRQPRKQGSYVDISHSVVRQINARTVANSRRFVFSKTNDPWIKPFTIKGKWVLGRLK